MRSRVWLYFCVLGTGAAKLLASPGEVGAGEYCCSFFTIGEMRFAGMILPAKGVFPLNGSFRMPPVMADAGTPLKSPLKKTAGICVESAADCWVFLRPSYEAMKNVLSLPL